MGQPDGVVGWRPGRVIDGKFEVKELIGMGGMGAVFRVRHREWNLDLAVKMPLAEVVAEKASRERYIREAETWIDLGVYPHIVQCWFVQEIGGIPLLFLDYLTGGSLKEWIDTGYVKPGKWDTIIDLTMQACDGLAYAHSRGLIHRDVKPANLLIRGDDRLCVTDFGIVKTTRVEELVADFRATPESVSSLPESLKSPSMTLTGRGSLLGTPEYGAPEQWGHADEVGPEADVYALGVVLFELCCGRRPYDEGDGSVPPSLLIGRHLSKDIPDPREFREDVPEVLAELTKMCLAKQPGERPSSMLELRQRLAEAHQKIFNEEYLRPVPKPSEQRADALNNRAVSLYSLHKKDEAMEAWRNALDYDSGHCETIYNSATTRWRQGQINRDEVVRRLQQIKSNRSQGSFLEGMFWLEAGEPEKARDALEVALKDKEMAASGTAQRAYGDANMYLEKFYLSEKAYKKALDSMPDDGETKLRKRMATVGKRSHQGHIYFPVAQPRHQFRRQSPIKLLVPGTESCCFSWDGQRLDAWNVQLGHVLWSTETREVGNLSFWENHGWLSSSGMLWSADGELLQSFEKNRLLTVVANEPRGVLGGKSLELVSLPDGRSLHTYERPSEAICATVISDGHRLLAGGRDGKLTLRDLETGDLLQTIETGGYIERVLEMRGGSFALTSDGRGQVAVWNLASGTALIRLSREEPVKSLQLDPSEEYLLVTTTSGYTVWRIGGGQIRQGLGGACFADTARLVCFDDGRLGIIDLASGRVLRSLKGLQESPVQLSSTLDGRYLAASTLDSLLHIWEFDEKHRVYERTLMLSRSKSHAEAEMSRERFQAEIAQARNRLEAEDYSAALHRLHLARRVAGYGRDPEVLDLQAVLTRQVGRKGLTAMWERRALPGAGVFTSKHLCLAPQPLLVGVAEGERVKLYDFTTGNLTRTVRGHQDELLAIALSRSGDCLLSATGEPALLSWNLEEELASALPTDGVTELAISEDETVAVGIREDGKLYRWSLEEVSITKSIAPVPGSDRLMAVTADGRLALTGPNLFVWNTETGNAVLRPTHLSTDGRDDREALQCRAAAITREGDFVATASLDNVIRVWRVADGRCCQTLFGHTQPIVGLAIFNQQRFAVSADCGGELRIWDLDNGDTLETLKAHHDSLTGFRADSQGRFFLTSGRDRALRLWELEWELDLEARPTTLADRFKKRAGAFSRLTALFRRR